MTDLASVLNTLGGKTHILGVDEVGYGCLAGPLVVCGVRAEKNWWLDGLGDSKKLSEKKRHEVGAKLSDLISNNTIAFHIAERSSVYIDEVGVAVALKEAYVECFHKLYTPESLIISDGILKFDNLGVDAYDKVSLIKADGKIAAVMAASILAKNYRDKFMKMLHGAYPQYNWASNVGYGSKEHLAAIELHGPSAFHRFSYAPMKNMKHG